MTVRIQVLDGGHPFLEELTQDGGVPGNGPRDRRLGGAEELAQLLLDVIAPQITQRHDHRFEQSKGLLTSESFGLRPKGLCDHRAQGDDPVLAETRSMIHVTACSPGIECGNPILSKNRSSPIDRHAKPLFYSCLLVSSE